jgi:2'-5' RNA ligase
MRLFVAINFNSDTKYNLLALRDKLRSLSKRGNFVAPENLHLTLAFLGECHENQVADIKAVMAATVFQPFDLVIERIGRFRRDSGDIWWAGLRECKELLGLQQDLTVGLCAKGFKFDKLQYNPHITLGRKVLTDIAPQKTLIFGETIKSIELMNSERIDGKLTYSAIFKTTAENCIQQGEQHDQNGTG